MKVLLRNPRREIEVDGPMSVHALLARLDVARGSVLVISEGTIVPVDATLSDDATVEIRPVISGGAVEVRASVGEAAGGPGRETR